MSNRTIDLPGASPKAIQHHYDVGNDFFALFQDETRAYSCAMFEGEDSLADAQRRKHDWHIANAGAVGKSRVLDIGCGWGGTLRRMVEQHSVQQAVGLTLSEAQQAYIHGWNHPKLEVRLESWADHQAMPYDAIISIGAFEHFARYRISQEEKVASYRYYFHRCHELLQQGGRMTLQTMAYGDLPRGAAFRDEFIANEIFPESDFPRLADIAEACEGSFEIRLVRNDREDYARTFRHWFEGLRTNRNKAVALVGEQKAMTYERYLRMFSYSFAIGAFHLLRIIFDRVDYRYHGMK